jgi:hypothetical protein
MRARAGAALRDLLGDEDQRVRIHAYEAVRRLKPMSMVSVVVGRDPGNFVLDVVPADGPPLIYARRTGTRRIALIAAEGLTLNPPLLYAKPGRQITLSAQPGDRLLSVLRKETGRVAGEFRIPLKPVKLVQFMGDDPRTDADGEPEGLGLDYTVVLDVLQHLCESGAMNGELRWEEPSVEDLLGPLRPMGRPESEL